jgi:hypothetical protein
MTPVVPGPAHGTRSAHGDFGNPSRIAAVVHDLLMTMTTTMMTTLRERRT